MGTGILLSQLEEQNEKFEKRLWTIEQQVAFLNKMYTEMDRREADSNAESKRPFPRYSFIEWLHSYGYQNEDKTWVIEEADVVNWLKRCGLENYI